ncbi:class I SAM-dependent DNA methyltransferase [Longispora urticae]
MLTEDSRYAPSADAVHYSDGFSAFYRRYYTRWVRALSPLLADYLRELDPHATRLLDLCCGTGESIAVFARAGWEVAGVDLSTGMLAQARSHLADPIAAGRVSLTHADAVGFTLPSPTDAAICLDGALNHLLSVEQLRGAFAAVHAALRPGASFVFDLYEPPHFRHWHHIGVMDEPDAIIVKRGIWDEDGGFGMLRVSGAFGAGDTMRRVDQNLRSRVFAPELVEALLDSTGFSRAGCDVLVPACPCGHGVDGECRTTYRAVRR